LQVTRSRSQKTVRAKEASSVFAIIEFPDFISQEALMEDTQSNTPTAARRDEDIALDLMRFVAMTTGYGRTTSTGVGFQGTGAAAKPEDYADHLLELYGKCLGAVRGKK
jgi:hypothetical protein